jgi:hypothetical protein
MTVAAIHFALGDMEQGFSWLTRAFDQRHAFVRYAKMVPHFDKARSDPRFQPLVARLKMPESVNSNQQGP